MARVVCLAIALIVSGCGIPPVITIATYAIDGVTLAASGKTVRDHALSAAVDQDCALFRVVSEGEVCSDYEPTAEAAAALDQMPVSEAHLQTTSDGRVIRVAVTPEVETVESGAVIRLSWVPPAADGTIYHGSTVPLTGIAR